MKTAARLAAVGLLMIALTMAGTTVAFAHATRVSADPPENAALTVGPARVSATFNEQLQTTFAAMTVVGPDGNLWSAGEPRVQGAVVSIDVRPLGPVGTYTVNYRVTSADGHVVSGLWSFRLTVPGTGQPGPPAVGTDTRGTIPLWPFLVGALVLVAAAALWAARHRS
jgi:methionine-rich copper-binding protein CopC